MPEGASNVKCSDPVPAVESPASSNCPDLLLQCGPGDGAEH
ncbi:MAG: hypothetical protein IH849_08140 [Acidobacteria bacterium]|nr:hypothetical protein [Acidobacteriota bacterium]